jgi:hypothetical protein
MKEEEKKIKKDFLKPLHVMSYLPSDSEFKSPQRNNTAVTNMSFSGIVILMEFFCVAGWF